MFPKFGEHVTLDKSNRNENVIMNNKIVLTNRLLHNIVLSAFLKPMPKDSKELKSAKLGHHMEKALIKNLLSDSKNENVATVSPIEAV